MLLLSPHVAFANHAIIAIVALGLSFSMPRRNVLLKRGSWIFSRRSCLLNEVVWNGPEVSKAGHITTELSRPSSKARDILSITEPIGSLTKSTKGRFLREWISATHAIIHHALIHCIC